MVRRAAVDSRAMLSMVWTPNIATVESVATTSRRTAPTMSPGLPTPIR